MIASLVKTSRLENHVIQLRPQRGDIGQLLAELYETYAGKAAAAGRTLELVQPEHALSARFDRKWTLEAVGNLIDNAIKYTETGGHIRLTATDYEMFVRIDVTDNGMGIAEEEQAQIFGRFYRSQTVSDEKGVGIGLYLAREIIEKEDGYLRLQSKPGAGSCFSVFLPK